MDTPFITLRMRSNQRRKKMKKERVSPLRRALKRNSRARVGDPAVHSKV